jgi:pyrroloquinoline quinone (PQQ) biosynthesis protein C
MIGEKEITRSLNSLVDGFMEETPFFRVWKEGSVDLSISRKFLLTFDSLVKSFPTLIAAGIERAQDEETRSTLAVNLFQEQGEGDPSRSHHAIYRKFLSTAGMDVPAAPEEAFAAEWRERLLGYIDRSSGARALGVLAAGEFLAQPVLGRIYSIIEPLYPGADREYFTKHLVLETEHVREVTAAIARLSRTEGEFEEVASGFKMGLAVWRTYFEHLTGFIAEKQHSH